MTDLRLREALRPLAEAIAPQRAMDAQRKVLEGFRDDGSLEPRTVVDAIPLQRIDMTIPGGASTGVQPGRFFIPEGAIATRLALVASANASATFQVNVLVDGVSRGSASVRVGTTGSSGVFNVNLPGGSVVSFQSMASIAQAVTVSIFYRPVEG